MGLARTLVPATRIYLGLRLLATGVCLLPMLFLAPFLLASLVHPGYYRADELPAIGVLAAAVVSWSGWLCIRARRVRPGT